MIRLPVRRATAADLPVILGLLQRAMHRDDDPRFDALFRWKHLENAFGESPMWIAHDGEHLAGFRAFLRWEFERPDGGVARVVRAVDTATDPAYQGRGIFTDLTLGAVGEMTGAGTDFVFNTPNDQSRPGYLRMGWREIGRAPAAIRPTRVTRLPALRGARVAASHWSEPVQAGVSARTVLDDTATLAALLAARPAAVGLQTRLTPEVLRWRYGSELLQYRAITLDGDVRNGVAFVRVRTRGRRGEAVLAQVIVPARDRARRRIVRAVVRALGPEADYVLALGPLPGFAPLGRLGPVVTTRTLATGAPVAVRSFALTLGDVELF